MKALSVNEMVVTTGGAESCGFLEGAIIGLSCTASLAWPIGTAIAGPTCVGLSTGCIVAELA